MPSAPRAGLRRVKLEGQNGSVVAPFEFLTPEFRSSFRCAKLLRKGSGVDFGARSGEFPARLGNIDKIDQNLGLENMKFGLFWVVVAPFGLGLAVVRGTGPKFHYRPLFGHIGPPGAQNRPFWVFGVTSDFLPAPGLLLPIVPRWLSGSLCYFFGRRFQHLAPKALLCQSLHSCHVK